MSGATLLALEAESGWGRAERALGPKLALLVSAVLAPLSGRLFDPGRGAVLITAVGAPLSSSR